MCSVAFVCVSVCPSVYNALTIESSGLQSSFLYADTTSESSGQVRISRSSGQGQGQGHMSKKARNTMPPPHSLKTWRSFATNAVTASLFSHPGMTLPTCSHGAVLRAYFKLLIRRGPAGCADFKFPIHRWQSLSVYPVRRWSAFDRKAILLTNNRGQIISPRVDDKMDLYCVPWEIGPHESVITTSNPDRFTEFFHRWEGCIYSKRTHTIFLTTP